MIDHGAYNENLTPARIPLMVFLGNNEVLIKMVDGFIGNLTGAWYYHPSDLTEMYRKKPKGLKIDPVSFEEYQHLRDVIQKHFPSLDTTPKSDV